MLRMKLSALTLELYQEIVSLYDDTVGGNGSCHLDTWGFEDDLKRLNQGHSEEYRFGSKVTHHSKLWIKSDLSSDGELLIYFRFDANTIAGENESLGKELASDFERAVDDFLLKRGLSV